MLLLFFFTYIWPVVLSCTDDGVEHVEGEKWIRNGNFLVTCDMGKIKVLNCLTDSGSVIDLGTSSYFENGVEYSCIDDDESTMDGSGEEISVNDCPENADGSQDIVIGNFLICCISKKFKGCIDDYGDWIKSGHFVLGKGLLKYCNVQKNGMTARIEPKGVIKDNSKRISVFQILKFQVVGSSDFTGCFNGSRTDDVEDTSLHVKKYTVWRQGAYEMRCGDEGIHVHKCYVNGGKSVYVGQAWIDFEGIVNICK